MRAKPTGEEGKKSPISLKQSGLSLFEVAFLYLKKGSLFVHNELFNVL